MAPEMVSFFVTKTMKYIKDKHGKPVNPYSWNSIIDKRIEVKKDKKVKLPSEAEAMITHPVFSMVGKFLGIDMRHDWKKNYEKVYLLTDYAVQRSGSKDVNHIIEILKEKLNNAPEIAGQRIDDLVVAVKLEQKMKKVDHNGNETKNDDEEVLEK